MGIVVYHPFHFGQSVAGFDGRCKNIIREKKWSVAWQWD
jgi:hypothetical protein